ncbi:MAG: glycosyltransferase family 1 protein [Lachnospiraceae bacterium]|nr:glycosyltransferase family 1 protein [Lachnospiraceae bacterium]
MARKEDSADESRNSAVQRMLACMKEGAYKLAILYSKNAEDYLGYENCFIVDAEAILGIAYTDELTEKIGAYHPLCAEAGMYELMCRVVMETGNCAVLQAESWNKTCCDIYNIPTAELTFIYAYVVRLHMQELHRRNRMDKAFTGICNLLQEKGCLAGFQLDMNLLLTDATAYERIARWTAPFLILRGDDTCGGVLQRFADDLKRALVANGQAVIEIGRNEAGGETDYNRLQQKVYKGIVGFQTSALEIDYFRNLKGAKFQFWFDNPLNFEGILQELPEDYYVLCQDADHAEWIRKYYHTEHAIQFPPGGVDTLQLNEGKVEIQQGDDARPYDIVFMGRYFADEPEKLNPEQKMFYDYLLKHPNLNFVQAIQELLEQLADGKDQDIPGCMRRLKPACRAVIGHFRNKVVEVLLQSGIKVQVYGDAWERYEGAGIEYLEIHPEVSVEESLEELSKAKIGLNVMSWYKAGMTERVANIMLSGAVCVADETSCLREHTVNGEETVLYRLDQLGQLPDMVKRLLADDVCRVKIARNAYMKAKQEFAWEARARQLVSLAEERL